MSTKLTSEQSRVVNFLASAGPYATDTVETADLKAIILATGGNIMGRGRLWNIVPTHLGAGIYKLSLELTNP